MRRVRWEEWQQVRRSLPPALEVAQLRRREGMRRPRTDQEAEMLVRSAVDAVRRAERSGRLVWLGPRRAALR